MIVIRWDMEEGSGFFDYRAQSFAKRRLLPRQYRDERELEDRIQEAEELAAQSHGAANEHWVEEWISRVHSSVYQGAAHSMAAVGMIAPLIESAFKQALRRMERDWSGQKGIISCVGEIGMKEYMPDDIKVTLQALFDYRNAMFHSGFEWPIEERERFEKNLLG